MGDEEVDRTPVNVALTVAVEVGGEITFEVDNRGKARFECYSVVMSQVDDELTYVSAAS